LPLLPLHRYYHSMHCHCYHFTTGTTSFIASVSTSFIARSSSSPESYRQIYFHHLWPLFELSITSATIRTWQLCRPARL
jgi:hypothetical protein